MSLFSQKKRLLVLFGSPHGHGHTHRLLETFLHPFRENHDWEVEQVDLYELSPPTPVLVAGLAPRKRPVLLRTWTPWTKPYENATCWWWPALFTTIPFQHQ